MVSQFLIDCVRLNNIAKIVFHLDIGEEFSFLTFSNLAYINYALNHNVLDYAE